LVEWLADELNLRYDVPQKIAQEWVGANQVLPLLDGLDEVKIEHRAACVEAINAFRQSHGFLPLVITSRTADYKALAEPLRLHGAILVRPLTREQVNAYLTDLGHAGEPIRAAIHYDPSLWELLDSPLLLNVLTVAYAGQRETPTLVSGTVKTPPPMKGIVAERRGNLLRLYVNQMLRRRAAERRYTPEQSVQWLSWLAAQMGKHGQTVFYLERMQFDWLPRRQGQSIRVCNRLAFGLVVGSVLSLVTGLVFGPVFGLVFGLAFALVFALVAGLDVILAGVRAKMRLVGLVVGLVLGSVVGLVRGSRERLASWLAIGGFVGIYALIFAMVFARTFELVGKEVGRWLGRLDSFLNKDILCVEAIQWSWSGIRQSMYPILVGALVGGLLGSVGGDLVGGLAIGLVVGQVVALTLGLWRGISFSEIETRAIPNEGIRRSARNALVLGLIVGLGSVLVLGLVVGLGSVLVVGRFRAYLDMAYLFEISGTGSAPRRGAGRFGGLAVGLFVGLAAGLVAGGVACLKHLVLRLWLIRNGSTPWNYVRFLDHAAERILLRKVGGGYAFIHRMLLEHFAARYVEPSSGDAQLATPSSTRDELQTA
jgi:hypothetical protein